MAKFVKADAEWREELSVTEFQITRKAGTETAFTGEYWDTKTEGIYRCRCCGEPLFNSQTKYDSGTGWPSFYEPMEDDAVTEREDRSRSVVRTEVRCSSCDAHLGHVFSDGPEPTGLRYCMNSASLKLDKDS